MATKMKVWCVKYEGFITGNVFLAPSFEAACRKALKFLKESENPKGKITSIRLDAEVDG